MTYTFDFNFTKNNNPSTATNKRNASKALDNLILSNLASMLGRKNEKREELSFSYTPKKKPTKTTIIDMDLTTPKKSHKPDMATFAKALAGLMKSKERDTYDFLLDDGTPIKLFSDEIQIGYELFDLDDAALALYKKLSDSRKKEIMTFISLCNFE